MTISFHAPVDIEDTMGQMSALAAEKDEEITHLRLEYLNAFQALLDFQDSIHPIRRTKEETSRLSLLTDKCTWAKYAYETAEMRRFTV